MKNFNAWTRNVIENIFGISSLFRNKFLTQSNFVFSTNNTSLSVTFSELSSSFLQNYPKDCKENNFLNLEGVKFNIHHTNHNVKHRWIIAFYFPVETPFKIWDVMMFWQVFQSFFSFFNNKFTTVCSQIVILPIKMLQVIEGISSLLHQKYSHNFASVSKTLMLLISKLFCNFFI